MQDRDGVIRAAITVGTNVSVVEKDVMIGVFLPHLQESAAAIEHDLTAQPIPLPAVEALSSFTAQGRITGG